MYPLSPNSFSCQIHEYICSSTYEATTADVADNRMNCYICHYSNYYLFPSSQSVIAEDADGQEDAQNVAVVIQLIAEDADGQEDAHNVVVVIQLIAEDADGQEDAQNVAVVIQLIAEDADGMEDVEHAVAAGFKKFINNEACDNLYSFAF